MRSSLFSKSGKLYLNSSKQIIYIDFIIPDNKLYHKLIIKKNILNIIKHNSGNILNINIYSNKEIDKHSFDNIGVKTIYPLSQYKKNQVSALGNNIRLIMGSNYMIVKSIEKQNYIVKNNKQPYELIIDNTKKINMEKPIYLEELYK